jgi:catechol 2,3-dioxygenase-like lactoylglutathione lyase family enzyme
LRFRKDSDSAAAGARGPTTIDEERHMEINGIAHVMLTVADVARCAPFYRGLLALFGLTPVIDTEQMLYCIGGRTAVGIMGTGTAPADDRFDQGRVGLHHVCFRARTRADVDTVHRFLVDTGARVVHAPEEGVWAPGYYSVLFEDPEGIRLEVNHVPGKGLLASPTDG